MTTTLRFTDNTTRTAANLEAAISLALVRYPDLARETEDGYTTIWATVADCENGAAPVADIIEAGSVAPTDFLAACTRNALPSISATMTLDNRTAISTDLGNDVQVRHAECVMGASYLTSPHVTIMSRSAARRHMASLAESGWTNGVAPWVDYTTATVNSITLRHLPGAENALRRRVVRSTLLTAGISDALDMVRDVPGLVGELALYALANNLAN